jgi:hypothetical protein
VSPTERRAIHLKRCATSFILRPSISGSRNLAASSLRKGQLNRHTRYRPATSSLPVWTTVSVSSLIG